MQLFLNRARPRPRPIGPAGPVAPLPALTPEQVLAGRPAGAEAELPGRPATLSGANTREANAALAAIDQIGNDQAKPVAVTSPATTDAAPAGGFRRAAGAVGTAIKDNPLAAVNAVMGIAGVIENATAKTPAVPNYQDFTPNLAPATGMNTGLKQQLINRINRNTARAGQAVTSDGNALMAQRLQAAATGNEQLMQVEQQDAQQLQQNMDRNQQVRLDADRLNHEGRQAQRRAVFDQENTRAQAQKAQGTAMAQGALTYFAQADASHRQEQQAQIQRLNDQKRARYTTLATLLNSGTLSAAEQQQYAAELKALEAEAGGSQAAVTSVKTSTTSATTRADGGLVPVVLFRRGGAVGTTTKTTESSTSAGGHGDVATQMLRDVRRSLDQVTEQNMRNIGQTLREIFRARTRPMPK